MNNFDISLLPNVSVLMTVYNTKPEWIAAAIDSILQQTYKNFELVIVNDGSINEETNQTLNDYVDQNSIINLITFEKNLGRVSALNEGLKKCQNELIFIFDSDDIAFNNAIEEQVKFFINLEKENKDISVLGCQLNLINAITEERQYSTNHPFKISKKNFHEIKDKYWFVNNPCVLLKKSVLLDEKFNGYNQELKDSFPEDFDLWMRLLSEGYSIYNSNNILCNYRINGNNSSLSKKSQNKVIGEKQTILIENLLKSAEDDKLLFRAEDLKKGIKIPKIIHQIWIGPKKSPINLMNSLKEIYHDWEYILWDEDKIKRYFPNGLKNQTQFDMFAKINRYDGMSDILRYEILEKFGGFYCDADTFAINKIPDEFLTSEIFFSYENEENKKDLIANCYIGCEPNNFFIKKIIHHVSLIEDINHYHHAWQLTGPQLVTNLIKDLSHEELVKIKIYNSDNFIPYWYEKCQFKDDMISKKCYSNHIWGSKKDVGLCDDLFNISNYNYTIVSAYIPKLNDYEDKSLNKYLNRGRELLMLPIPKIIFLPEELIDWGLNNSNQNFTKIVKFEKNDMYDFFWNDLNEEEKNLITKPVVPSAEFQGKFNVKDTTDYLICQNHKSQWLKIASDLNYFEQENFMWIDFGISHIIKKNNLLDLFETKINSAQKILIPSIWSKIKNNTRELLNVKLDLNIVNWYTLGGVVLINKKMIDTFNDLCKVEIINLLKNEKFLTWEVNIWSLVAQKNIDMFELYFAGFDESIIQNLFHLSKQSTDLIEKLRLARENNQHQLGLEYYESLKKDELFYQQNQEKIDYEMTILYYYCFKNQKTNGSKFLIKYLNQFSYFESNVWSNLKYYVNTLNQHKETKIKSLQHLELKNQYFHNTSPCKLIMKNGEEHVNIRYVNYEYDENNNIVLSNRKYCCNENPVRTKNLYNGEIEFKMNEQGFLKSSNIIEGYEDIRLFEKDNKIRFLATTKGYTLNNPEQFNVVTGEYDIVNHETRLEKIFPSPDLDKCEKNWVMLNEKEMIYKWSPIRIYDYENLQPQRSYNVPKIFNYFRGSSNPITIGEFKYCVVHSVHYENTRKYLHWIVKLNQDGYPLAYSVPFDFEGEMIEYCLSMNYLKNGNLEFHYSVWDKSSKSLEIPFEYFNDKLIEV